MRKTIQASLVVAVLGIPFLEAGELSKTEEKTFPMTTGGSVSIGADEGDITVQAWDKSEVFVKATMKAWSRRRSRAERILEKIRVDMTLDGNRLTLSEPEDRRKQGSDFFDMFGGEWFRDGEGYSVDYALTVPKGVDIQAEADEGDITCQETSGDLDLSADEGDIKAENADIRSGRLEADEGDIRLQKIRCSGTLIVEADEGDIRIADSDVDELDVSADEGNVVLKDLRAKRFKVSLDEGDVDADFTPMHSGSYAIETDEGEIRMWIPENASLRVDLETGEGRTDSDFRLDREESDSGDRMQGDIGGGNASLRAAAGEGDIALLKKRDR